MSRTPIRDGWFPSRPLVSPRRRPLESPPTRHSRDQEHAPYPDTGRESRGGVGCGNDTRTLPPTGASIFITWCAGASRHDRFVRKHVPDSDPGCAYAAFERAVEPLHSAISSFRPPNSSFPRRRESRGEVRVVAMTLELSHQPMHPIFVPWCAGTSRHERLVRRHVPDSDPGWIPAPAGDHRRRRSSEYSRRPAMC